VKINENLIGVVYLYYVPFGINQLCNFFESYNKFKPTINHDLVILVVGKFDNCDNKVLKDFISLYQINATVIISPKKFDIGSYFYVSSVLKNKYILFLNSYSRFKQSDWLEKLSTSVLGEDVGVVGCTGAWSDFGGNHLYRGRNPINLIYSWIIFRYNFYPKIGPHLRTNAFMIERNLFQSLEYYSPKPYWFFYFIYGFNESKLKSFCFEHGMKSMTNQLLSKGYKILIVGKNGIEYPIERWIESDTFWIGGQENLLIGDNQTDYYSNASLLSRNEFTKKAWHIYDSKLSSTISNEVNNI
jgi:hypothetical protein